MKVKREGLATGTQEKSDDWRVRKKRMGKRKRRDVYFPFGSGFQDSGFRGEDSRTKGGRGEYEGEGAVTNETNQRANAKC